MKRIATLAAALLMLAAPEAAAASWLKTVAEAQKVARQKNQLILVDMYADWCGWCHRFESDVFPTAVFQQAASDLVLLRLDTEDGAEGTQMARKFEVTSLPTFVLLTPDLTLAGVIKGYAPAPAFVDMLKETRGKHDAFLRRVKNEKNLGKDYIQRLELAKDFVTRSAWKESEPRLQKLSSEKGVPAAVRDEALYQLAVGYTMQRKYDEAVKSLRKLTSLSRLGESVERGRVLLGQVYLQQGNLLGARNEFVDFKRTFPNSPLIMNIDRVLPEIERRLSASK